MSGRCASACVTASLALALLAGPAAGQLVCVGDPPLRSEKGAPINTTEVDQWFSQVRAACEWGEELPWGGPVANLGALPTCNAGLKSHVYAVVDTGAGAPGIYQCDGTDWNAAGGGGAGSDDQTAAEVPYTPAVGADWTPDPTHVAGAADQLAERVTDLEGATDDHGALAGLADDDHPQYALLAGRTGGQSIVADPATSTGIYMDDDSVQLSGPDFTIEGHGGAQVLLDHLDLMLRLRGAAAFPHIELDGPLALADITAACAGASDATRGTMALTTTQSMTFYNVTDADGCNLTFSEPAGVPPGALLYTANTGTATLYVADSAGVVETIGDVELAIAPRQAVAWVYSGTAWAQVGQAHALTADLATLATTATTANAVAPNSVALGTDTTGGYAASTTEGGPATTATALAANGANCSAGSYPLGVDASGAVEGCTVDATGTDSADDLTNNDLGDLGNVVETGEAAGRALVGNAGGGWEPSADEVCLQDGTNCPAGGSIGGSTGATDNRVLRSDGTGGATLQASGVSIDDSGNLQLPSANTATTPALCFSSGTCNSGFYETAADNVAVSLDGTRRFVWTGNQFNASVGGGAGLVNSTASATVPTVLSSRDDTNTGHGWGGADDLRSIAGGVSAQGYTATHVKTFVRPQDTVLAFEMVDNGNAGTKATGTLTPSTGYSECSCLDAAPGGCDASISETGTLQGQLLTVVNIGTQTCDFADAGGVLETPAGGISLGINDAATFRYASDRWITTGVVDN